MVAPAVAPAPVPESAPHATALLAPAAELALALETAERYVGAVADTGVDAALGPLAHSVAMPLIDATAMEVTEAL